MPAVDPMGSFWSAQEDHIQTLWRIQGVRLLEIYAKGYGLTWVADLPFLHLLLLPIQ